MKRGFSLFTPLVGTAVVIMTILAATTIVQNDARLSRSITTSYITSSQAIIAKVIRGAATVQILYNIESTTKDFLTGGVIPLVGECSYAGDCWNEVDYWIDELDLTLTTGGEGIYSGIIDSVNAVTSYKTSVSQSDVSQVLDNIRAGGKRAVDSNFTPQNTLKISIDDAAINRAAMTGDKNLLALTFWDDATDNMITVSIVPRGFYYTTPDLIRRMIERTIETHDLILRPTRIPGRGPDVSHVKSLDSGDTYLYQHFDRAVLIVDGANKTKLSVNWTVYDGEIMQLTFVEKNFGAILMSRGICEYEGAGGAYTDRTSLPSTVWSCTDAQGKFST